MSPAPTSTGSAGGCTGEVGGPGEVGAGPVTTVGAGVLPLPQAVTLATARSATINASRRLHHLVGRSAPGKSESERDQDHHRHTEAEDQGGVGDARGEPWRRLFGSSGSWAAQRRKPHPVSGVVLVLIDNGELCNDNRARPSGEDRRVGARAVRCHQWQFVSDRRRIALVP